MKAYQMPFKAITVIPKATFAEKRYHFVTVDNTGGGIVCPAGAKAIGVTQEPNKVGEPTNVMVAGVSFVVLGGAVAAGAEVEVDATGKAVTLTTGKSVGICLVGGVADDIASILLG